MTQGNETEKIWLRDDKGNLYALTPEVLAAIKVPDQHKSEAEEVIGGKDDTAGFSAFGAQNYSGAQFQLAGAKLNLVGACRCGRSFGLNLRQFGG